MTTTATPSAAVTTIPILAVGDEVTINHPRYTGTTYVVAQVKRTKCIVRPKGQPAARGLDAPMTMLTKSTPGTGVASNPLTVERIPLMTLTPGMVVRLNQPFRRNTAGPMAP